jgi:hypothetical protein
VTIAWCSYWSAPSSVFTDISRGVVGSVATSSHWRTAVVLGGTSIPKAESSVLCVLAVWSLSTSTLSCRVTCMCLERRGSQIQSICFHPKDQQHSVIVQMHSLTSLRSKRTYERMSRCAGLTIL